NQVEPALDYGAALIKKGLRIYAVSNLHAKLYISEQRAVLSSMNLLDSSFEKAIEFGLVVDTPAECRHIRTFLEREIKGFRDVTGRDATQARSKSPERAAAGVC